MKCLDVSPSQQGTCLFSQLSFFVGLNRIFWVPKYFQRFGFIEHTARWLNSQFEYCNQDAGWVFTGQPPCIDQAYRSQQSHWSRREFHVEQRHGIWTSGRRNIGLIVRTRKKAFQESRLLDLNFQVTFIDYKTWVREILTIFSFSLPLRHFWWKSLKSPREPSRGAALLQKLEKNQKGFIVLESQTLAVLWP